MDDSTSQFAQLKGMSPRFAKQTDDVLGSWIDLATPVVAGYKFPKEYVDYATNLYAAHIGIQVLNTASNGVATETMGPITRTHFDWSDKVNDPFLDLFNKLLNQFGLGNNQVMFF